MKIGPTGSVITSATRTARPFISYYVGSGFVAPRWTEVTGVKDDV
jgi:hypothetical protein